MKNKNNLKKRFLLFFLGFFILSIIVSLVNSDEATDNYNKGYNITKLLEDCNKNPASCQRLTENIKPELLKGIIDSIDESKVGKDQSNKNLEALTELWFKKFESDDGNGKKTNTNTFDDKSKNKIMELLNKDQKNDFLKKMINTAYWKKYKKSDFKNPENLGIKDFNIDDKIGKLQWVGNRFGLVDKEGKPTAWIDFENVPRWMNKVSFSDDKFQLGFFTGAVQKDITLNGGTIGERGEVVGPDGKVIGITMNQNLKSVKFENEKLIVNYFDFAGTERQLTLAKENLPPGILQKVVEKQNDPTLGPIIQKALNELSGIGIDPTNGQSGAAISENQLNILYSGGISKNEIINLDYSNQGKLKVSAENGGTIASIDSHGNILTYYNQFFSADNKEFSSKDFIDSYNSKHPDAKISDEKAEFVFGLDGTVKAGKNALISAPGFGSLMTSREDFIGTDIIRNPYIDALARQDYKMLTETGTREAYDTIKRLLSEGKIDPKDKDAISQLAISESAGFLKRNIEDPSFGIELKKELNNAITATLQDIEKSQANIADFLTKGAISDPQRDVASDYLKDTMGSLGRDVAEKLLDPQKIVSLTNADTDQRKQIVTDIIKSSLKSNPQLNGLVDNSLVQMVSQLSVQNFNTPQITLSKLVDDAFERAADNSNAGKTVGQIVLERLNSLPDETSVSGSNVKLPILSTQDKQNIADAIQATVVQYQQFFDDERGRLIDELKKYPETRKNSEYSNRAIIDIKNKEVSLMGSDYIGFDADSPLRKFTATTSNKANGNKGEDLVLFSNGNYVASFKGNDIFTPSNSKPSDSFSIDSITSTTNPSISYTYKNNGYGGYSLTDQKQVVSSSYQLNGFVKVLFFQLGFPIVSSEVQNPVGGDVGLDPNTQITIQDVVGMDKGRLFNRIKDKQLTKKYGTNGIPLGTVTPEAEANMNTALNELITGLGGDAGFEDLKKTGKDIFDFVDKYNINLPGGELTTLPTGMVVGGDVRDIYSLMSTVTKDNQGNYYIPDAKKLLDFFGNHVMRTGSTVTITNNQISINGDTITDKDINPALFRTITRLIYYNKNKLSGGIQLKK